MSSELPIEANVFSSQPNGDASSQLTVEALLHQIYAEGTKTAGRASHASSQEYQEEISQYYFLVRSLVGSYLISSTMPTDGTEVLSCLTTSNINCTIKLLQHVFVHFPDIITFLPPSQQTNSIAIDLDNSSTTEFATSNGDQFHLWLLTSLLLFLGNENRREFHEQVVIVVELLLGLIKNKVDDIGVFRRIMMDLLVVAEETRRAVELAEPAFISVTSKTSSELTSKCKTLLLLPHEITFHTPSGARQFLSHLTRVIVDVFRDSLPFLSDVAPKAWKLFVRILSDEVEFEAEENEDGCLRLTMFRSVTSFLSTSSTLPPANIDELLRAVVTHVLHFVTDSNFRPPNQFDLEEAMAECLESIFKYPLPPPLLRTVASAIEQSLQLATVLITFTLKNALFTVVERLLEADIATRNTIISLMPWLGVAELQPVLVRCLKSIVKRNISCNNNGVVRELERKIERVGKRKAEDIDRTKAGKNFSLSDGQEIHKKVKMDDQGVTAINGERHDMMDLDGRVTVQQTVNYTEGEPGRDVLQLAVERTQLFGVEALDNLLRRLSDITDAVGLEATKEHITISRCWEVYTIVQICLYPAWAKEDTSVAVCRYLQRLWRRYLRVVLTSETDEPWRLGTLTVLCKIIGLLHINGRSITDTTTSLHNEIFCILSLPWLHCLANEKFRSTIELQRPNGPSTLSHPSVAHVVEAISSVLDYDSEIAQQIQTFQIFNVLECWLNLKAICLPFIAAAPFSSKSATWFVDLFSSALSAGENDIGARICAWRMLPVMYANCSNASWRTALLEAARISEDDPSEILDAVAQNVGRLACARAGCFSNVSVSDDYERGIKAKGEDEVWFCLKCDRSKHITDSLVSPPPLEEWANYGFLGLKCPEPAIQLGFMRSLRRILHHAPDSPDLKESVVGTVLLKSMASSFRELRLLTGECTAILFEKYDKNITNSPSPATEAALPIFLEIKKLLDSSNQPELYESLLITVGRIGRVADDNVLVSSILCLIKYLGVENTFVRAVVVEEIRNVAMHRKVTINELFAPFLPQISRLIIDHLKTAPCIITHVTQLLSTNTHDFLQRTLEHTLPYLVSARNRDILEHLSQVLKRDIPDMCINEAHHILARLFMEEEEEETGQAMMFFLSIAKPDCNEITMASFLRSCTLCLVIKLAVELGDEDKTRQQKANKALKLVESKFVDANQRNADDPDVLSGFLRQHFLGVLAHINEIIDNVGGQKTWATKNKAIRSLEELIKLIGRSIYSVTPQVMATLQTVLDFPALQDAALTTWETFIRTLDIDHVIPLLNQIVLVLLRVFPECTESQRQRIVDILEYLIIRNADRLKPHLKDIANIPSDPELSKIKWFLHNKRGSLLVEDQLSQLVQRVRHESSMVTHQALKEMKSVLMNNQIKIMSMILAETVDPLINDLFRMLLEGCRKHNGKNLAIQRLCSECLGIIGAVDPSRLDVCVLEENLVMLTNFVDREESVDFACKMIENQLVRAFRSARDTKQQGYLAYSIQELLKFCGFTAELLSPLPLTTTMTTSISGIQQHVRQRWDQFPKLVHETVSPLLDAKYSVASGTNRSSAYPIYPSKHTFKEWLQTWTVDLLGKVNGDNARKIFGVCKNIIKSDDANIALYLLPHLVLNILISGTAENRSEILSELLAVLNDVRMGSSSHTQEVRQLCCQTIFSLIDHFTKWIRLKRQKALKAKAVMARRAGKSMNADEDVDTDASLQVVENLLSKIPQNVMAEASYRCKAYARALMHFEQHMRSERKAGNENDSQPLYEQLQRIYAHIDEPDGMEGITSRFQARNLEQQILEDESAGRWTAAQTCYELSLQEDPNNLDHQIGLINCLKNLGHLETILTHIRGLATRHPEWSSILTTFAVEASWRLGNWESLEQFLNRPSERTFEIAVGKILLSMHRGDGPQFAIHLQAARDDQMSLLAAASMESYRRGYDSILKLHMLYELESTFNAWKTGPDRFEKCAKEWDERLKITLPSFKVREPILNLRRILLHDLKPKDLQVAENDKIVFECGRIWLQSAKISRKAGYFQTAYSAILHATKLRVPFFYVERAKWLWHKGQERKAIQELQGAILDQVSNVGIGKADNDASSVVKDVYLDTKSEEFMKAKATLLLAKWTEDTSQSDSNTILKKYNQVVKEQNQWEKGFYYLGRYYNKLYGNEQRSDSKRPSSKVQLASLLEFVCKNYGRALTFGTRYIYQTMPRLLTMWLDFGLTVWLESEQSKTGATATDPKAKSEIDIATRFLNVNKRIRDFSDSLPAYQFLTAFPQIISRICHQNKNVFDVLEKIIMNVLTVYPQQALWSMMSVSRSTYATRKTRCNNILAKVKSNSRLKHLENMVEQAMKLTDQLLLLSNFVVQPRDTVLSITKDFRNLQRITPLNIIVPLQVTLIPTLPASASTVNSHNPFPTEQPTIAKFQDEVEIMSSLQKPRKITIMGSDGRDYIFLCKPKDDLRKDARLMEFNSMINKLLKKDPESRRRQLRIRTYAVVPLNEECGLIEWVNNTIGLRHILNKLHKSKGVVTPVSEIRNLLEMTKPSGAEIFTNMILPKFPPVFHEWFLETFPEPTNWFASRLSYATTTAVMSMVGYILGLGDRHGENILFDETNGDCVHVDFNCLFEKGLTFERPERVPFRLTQNMVDAFGVTGYEGVFRKSCEVSLRVLRNNKESLMSVLETFIHDPLCEWSKKASTSGEVENEQAVKSLQTIERKLQGVMQAGLPLSIEGQTQELIRQATDPASLFQMYIGWASYM